MLASKAICPECQATLRLTSALPAGKKIKCPKCTATFAIPAGQGAVEEIVAQGPARPRASGQPPPRDVVFEVPDHEYEEPERLPARTVASRRGKAKSNQTLMWCLIGGGGAVVIAGVTILLIVLLSKDKKEPDDKDTKKDDQRVAGRPIPVGPGAGAKLATWLPDQTTLNQLAEPRPVGNYFVRPPNGYESQPVADKSGRANAYYWVGQRRNDGSSGIFTVIIAQQPTGGSDNTVESILRSELKTAKEQVDNFEEQPWDRGLINGHVFVRARFRGLHKEMQKRVSGFFFAASFDKECVLIGALDVDPHSEVTLRLKESAAATFRRR